MTWLSLLLVFKIVVTLLSSVLPLLLRSTPALARRLEIDVAAVPYLRLYAVALLALLVGYAGGLHTAERGVFPEDVVRMGIVSNAGATLMLLRTGLHRRLWPAAPIFGAIALGLVAASLRPDVALQRLW